MSEEVVPKHDKTIPGDEALAPKPKARNDSNRLQRDSAPRYKPARSTEHNVNGNLRNKRASLALLPPLYDDPLRWFIPSVQRSERWTLRSKRCHGA
jgi:hypothetical protein